MGKRYYKIRYGRYQPHSRGLKYFTNFTIIWVLFWGLAIIDFAINAENETILQISLNILAVVIYSLLFCYPMLILQAFYQGKVKKKFYETIYDYRPYPIPIDYQGYYSKYLEYGRKQEYSKILKYFSIFTEILLALWISILMMVIVESYKNIGETITFLFGWIVILIAFCFPIQILQLMGTKRVKKMAIAIDKWNETTSHQQTMNIRKQQHSYHNNYYPVNNEIKYSPNCNSLPPSSPVVSHSIDEKILQAGNYEKALRYEDAAKLYEECNMWEDAGRARLKEIELLRTQSLFKVDTINLDSSTNISDSVIHDSEIGSNDPPLNHE